MWKILIFTEHVTQPDAIIFSAGRLRILIRTYFGWANDHVPAGIRRLVFSAQSHSDRFWE